MKKLTSLIPLVVFLLVSCTSNEPHTYQYNTNPVYTWGYAEFFGSYYAGYGRTNNVLSISLFSDSLSVDSTNSLVGTGQYLFLEDVYVAVNDTLLPSGTYTVSDTGKPFTVTPGTNDTIDDEVYTLGATISYYEENTSRSVQKRIIDGTFTVSSVGLVYTIQCNFVTQDNKELKGSFTGSLLHYDESLQKNRSFARRFFTRPSATN